MTASLTNTMAFAIYVLLATSAQAFTAVGGPSNALRSPRMVAGAVDASLPPMFAAPIALASRVTDGMASAVGSVAASFDGHTLPFIFEAPLAITSKVNGAISKQIFSVAAKLGISTLAVKLTAVALAAVALLTLEGRRRASLIAVSDECQMGDEAACTTYEEKVSKTPNWKLNMALSKLSQTNFLADKLAGPAPSGFEWGARSLHPRNMRAPALADAFVWRCHGRCASLSSQARRIEV